MISTVHPKTVLKFNFSERTCISLFNQSLRKSYKWKKPEQWREANRNFKRCFRWHRKGLHSLLCALKPVHQNKKTCRKWSTVKHLYRNMFHHVTCKSQTYQQVMFMLCNRCSVRTKREQRTQRTWHPLVPTCIRVALCPWLTNTLVTS